MKFKLSFLLVFILFKNLKAQNLDKIDFYSNIKKIDFSKIWMADSITDYGVKEKKKFKKSEILGFIGTDYQRFYVHFISSIKNSKNPYEYFIYGKTKVKDNICSFQGTIKLIEAKLYQSQETTDFKQGFVVGEVLLFEDQKQNSTGYIFGKIITHFLIDNKGNISYDSLMMDTDGFSNNQFQGIWTSYKTNNSKKCNWGDYRIPDSSDLDIGAGEFSVNGKYVQNGWQSYKLAFQDNNNKIAREKENEKWWIN